MSGSRSFDTFLIAHFGCQKVAQSLSTSCPKAVHKLPEACWKVAPRHKDGKGHGSGPHKSCGALDRCIVLRISVRATLRQRHFLDRGRELDDPDLRNEISYCKGLKFASKNQKWQGLSQT